MKERLEKLREMTQSRTFKAFRRNPERGDVHWAFPGSAQRQATEQFKLRCRMETPVVLPDERIVFMRSRNELAWCRVDTGPFSRFVRRVRSIPGRIVRKFLPAKREWSIARDISNTSPDYALFLRDGFRGRIAVARKKLAADAGKTVDREFLECAIDGMSAVLELVGRYADEAERVGNREMAAMLRRIPAEPPKTLHEALQALRILQYSFYLHGSCHCGWGRMDQYLRPFYERDVAEGRLTRDAAGELLAEFFLAMNRDADLYPGVQQGDNGQSVMLGGCDPKTGESAVNDLTYLILEVARETRQIDPKINLRVDRNTPIDLLELGSELTKCGLGFPQYSNDEVVIPALVKKGYALEDARDYSVAACWEFVIPGRGMDKVNAAALSFPHAVDEALKNTVDAFSEERFRAAIRENVRAQMSRILAMKQHWRKAPFLSSFFDDALERGRDFSEIARYRNLGVHGAGAANAADAMAAVLAIFKASGESGVRKLLDAEKRDFAEADSLLQTLRNDMPKIGNANDLADRELKFLFDCFADVAEEMSTPSQTVRPGSGSAMYYVWLVDQDRAGKQMEPVVGATADGRRLNAPLAASLAPAHEAQVNGVLSVFKSFANVDYSRIMNGGPITIELSHSVFNTANGVKKLAQLVRYFVALGLQQLQLNVLDVAELEDAIAHPERHRNLIVRVWGWSGYFCELAPEYQRQIIRRHRYGV